ncbi:hypothetical protein [Lysinibacter cavernae]|uniref:Uncharacterized protein n=1 Tax=Lysinibacter cavernae TaxID=1640652 RepID=A0A7X5R2V4_9MICO|nr:hypothetical protein [Lysinibacter cavernae]NIH54365.1 hypothetical protein [Lysinibacter cavernae]
MLNRKLTVSIAILGGLLLAPALTGCTQDSDPNYTAVDLPSAFPTTVPLADGTVFAADKMGDTGWSASVLVDDAAAQDAVLQQLKDEGFTEQGSNESDAKARIFSLTDGTTAVTVVLKQVDGKFVVDYTFAPIPR